MLGAWQVVNFGCGNQIKQEQTESLTIENTPEMDEDKLKNFGYNYAEAWCSQDPESVAVFFAENGSLTVNNGTPAVGREAVAKEAEGFMTAFPDMVVTMDSLIATPKGVAFHWTLTGTNTGPNGTGKKVNISGFELWQLDKNGLIGESIGSFDAVAYDRQLKFGVNN